MGFIKGITGFLNKLIGKVFGKTHIFIIIFGWFLAITGVLMFWKPEKARQALAGQGFGLIKGYILVLALFLGALLVKGANKLNGLLALLVLVLGFVFLVKGYFLLKRTAAQKISQWMEKVPLAYLKVYVVIQAAIGIAMLVFRKRIYF
jgi:hypothetical protein